MEARNSFDVSAKKLRRARKLYGFLCSSHINNDTKIVPELASRAQKRGLYSSNTELKGIMYSLCRHAYKRSEYFDNPGGSGWYNWIDNHHRIWFY